MRKAAAQTSEVKKEDEVEKVEPQVENEVEVEIEDDPQPEKPVVAAPIKEPEVDKRAEEERAALQKRVEELQRSEEIARRRAAEFEKQAQERQAAHEKLLQERDRFRLDSETNQLEAINAAMVAAKSDSDAAEMMLEEAIREADPKRQAEAHRRLAKAEGNLARLQDGKDELEYRISLLKTERGEPEKKPGPQVEKQPGPQKEPEHDVIEALPIPDRAKEWLRENPEFATDARKNAKLQVAHWEALDEGHKEFSTPYFAAVERLLGLAKQEEVALEEPEEDGQEIEVQSEPVRKPAQREQRRSAIVSAPVSREGSTATSTASRSQVRLTKEEAEFAEQIGMSHAEYGKQKLKLQEMKRRGEIQ